MTLFTPCDAVAPGIALSNVDSICQAGTGICEDRIGHTDRAGWIIDGATSLNPEPLLCAQTDAEWIAIRTTEFLNQLDHSELSASELIRAIVDYLQQAFGREQVRRHLPAHLLPTASIALARVRNRSIELINLGDCRLLYWRAGREIKMFGTSRVEKFDQKLINFIKKTQEKRTIDYQDLAPLLTPLIEKNRHQINTDAGYWVLDMSYRSIPHIQIETQQCLSDDKILFMTDGFYRLIDIFHYCTYNELIKIIMDRGLRQIYSILRDFENDDEHCVLYPRIKPHDDAAALLLNVEVRI